MAGPYISPVHVVVAAKTGAKPNKDTKNSFFKLIFPLSDLDRIPVTAVHTRSALMLIRSARPKTRSSSYDFEGAFGRTRIKGTSKRCLPLWRRWLRLRTQP